MRITTEILLRLANDWVQQRIKVDHHIIAVYLHGSTLAEMPDLGGTVDIDLFVVRIDALQPAREIHRITDDVHLDIVNQPRDLYRNTRSLRLDPWLGPTIHECKILYDPQHFLDFIQAGVRAQFDGPENVLRRARQRADQARSAWLKFQLQPPEADPAGVSAYLDAVEQAANAVTLLTGSCLTERRFLPGFAARAAAVDRPGLLAGLLGLLGGGHASPDVLNGWLPKWQRAYGNLLGHEAPDRLHPQRFFYYYSALRFFLANDSTAQMALWPLLRTWTDMAFIPALRDDWQAAIEQIGWIGEGLAGRLDALDAYLDTVDEILDRWAEEHGAA